MPVHYYKTELTMLVPKQATLIVGSDHPLDEAEQKEAMHKAYESTTGYEFKYNDYSGIEGEHTWQGEIPEHDAIHTDAKLLWLFDATTMPATPSEETK